MQNNHEKLNDFFRCEEVDGTWKFQVGLVRWTGPHSPEIRWMTFHRWETEPNSERLQKAREAALADQRYFQYCARCRELKNAGHMHNDHTCQSCAERHLGIIH